MRWRSSAGILAVRRISWISRTCAPIRCSSSRRGISWPALNQIVCALRFFYGVTLGQTDLPERIPYAREPRKLPLVLECR